VCKVVTTDKQHKQLQITNQNTKHKISSIFICCKLTNFKSCLMTRQHIWVILWRAACHGTRLRNYTIYAEFKNVPPRPLVRGMKLKCKRMMHNDWLTGVQRHVNTVKSIVPREESWLRWLMITKQMMILVCMAWMVIMVCMAWMVLNGTASLTQVGHIDPLRSLRIAKAMNTLQFHVYRERLEKREFTCNKLVY